jgi:signal transduction histidine kinase
MKLWLRIFLSILVVSLTVLTVSSSYLINRSHLAGIEREQSRALDEFDYIRSSIANGISLEAVAEDSVSPLLPRYGDYYQKRGIHLVLVREDKVLFSNYNADPEEYRELLSADATSKLVRILTIENHNDILVSGLLTPQDRTLLITVRDITPVYTARSSNIRLSLLLISILILVLGSLSYLYSRWITKPVQILRQGAASVSGGDYSIRIPEYKDEFGSVAKAFNKMASAVEQRTTELTEHARELQEFIDDLSHEMNTPMTSIHGYSEFLMNANATDEQKQKAADNIRLQAIRMKEMLQKLMSLTITREVPPEITAVETTPLFQEVRSAFLTQTELQKVEIQLMIDLPTIHADRTLIYMLLCNLVKNSLQALPEGGLIRLKAYEENNLPILEVSDNGIGIPKDKLELVTKPFFRVDKSRSRKTGGAGLGLSICQNIANLHGAELLIESGEGSETRVTLRFYK